MPKVKIVSTVEMSDNLHLRNGGLLIFKDLIFLVSSSTTGNAKYCSIVDLSTGSRCFPEPCSRVTTRQRVTNHLKHKKVYYSKDLRYVGPKEYDIDISINAHPVLMDSLEEDDE